MQGCWKALPCISFTRTTPKVRLPSQRRNEEINKLACLPLLGPCDGDFGQQVNALRGLDILCLDQIALAIDSISGQESFVLNASSLMSLSGVEQRYVRQHALIICRPLDANRDH